MSEINELLNSFNDNPCENNGIIVAENLNASAGVTGAPPQTAIAIQCMDSASHLSDEGKTKWGEGSELIEEWHSFPLSSTPSTKSCNDTRIKGLEDEKIESVAQSVYINNNFLCSTSGALEVRGQGNTLGNYNEATSYSLLLKDLSRQDELINQGWSHGNDRQHDIIVMFNKFTVLRQLQAELFHVGSQINGSNGEWTNSDDVAGSQEEQAYHARKRAQKEAKKKQNHSKNADGKHGKVSFGPPITDLVVAEQPPPVKEELTYYSTGVSSIRDAVYQDRLGNPTLCPLVQDYILVDVGVEIKCSSFGYGWYIVSSIESKNTKTVFTQPSTIMLRLDGYRFLADDGKWVERPAREYAVYLPLFTELNKRFKANKLELALLNSINANCKLGLSSSLVEDSTFDYIRDLTHRKHTARLAVTDTNVLITNNSQSIGVMDAGYANAILEGTLFQDVHMPIQIADVEYEGSIDWEYRRDFTVLKESGNVEVDYFVEHENVYRDEIRQGRVLTAILEGDLTGEEVQVREPTRVVKVLINKRVKTRYITNIKFASTVPARPRHRTRYMTFKGLNQAPLVEYSNSANNLNHGLKRLMACRGTWEEELSFRKRAIRLGRVIAKNFSHEHKASDMCGLLIGKRTGREYFLGTRYDDMLQQKDDFVVSSLKMVHKQCHRAWIDYILDSCRNSKRWLFKNVYKQFLTDFAPFLSREAVADLPNIKRKLKQWYVNGCKLESEENLLVKSLEVHIKRELAKFSKVPRLFMAYGAGCMYAPELPEFVKKGIDGKHVFTLHKDSTDYILTVNIMAKPKPTSLEEIFSDLYNATSTNNTVYVAIYSDDSVYSGCINHTPFCFNGDVSSNDSSQDVPAFLMTYLLMANFHERRAWNLVKQCLLPINIVSPVSAKDKISIEFDGPFEGSGTTLTTILNHVGSLLIALSFFYDVTTDYPSTGIEEVYKEAAKYVGHSVTVDSCINGSFLNFNHVQFLKRSPFLTKEGWKPFTNLGAIFKNFGDVDDDLQATQLGVSHAEFCSMNHDSRINKFLGGVVKGWKHEPQNPVLSALRERFVSEHSLEVKHDSLVHVFDETIDLSSMDCTEAILSRYGLTMEELKDLSEQILNSRVGHHYSSTAIAKIMELDYGVGYL